MTASSFPLRLAIGSIAACVLLLAVGVYWDSHDGRRLRVAATALVRGYEGCLCPDCTRGFLGITTSAGGCCQPARPDATDIATIVGVPATASLLLVGPLWGPLARLRRRRRRDPTVCSGCRYPRAGLSDDAVCPECGRTMGGP